MKLNPGLAIQLGKSSLRTIELHGSIWGWPSKSLYFVYICSHRDFTSCWHFQACHFPQAQPTIPTPKKKCIASGNLTRRSSFSSSILDQKSKQPMIAWHSTGSRLSPRLTLKCIHSAFSFLCQKTSAARKVTVTCWKDSTTFYQPFPDSWPIIWRKLPSRFQNSTGLPLN